MQGREKEAVIISLVRSNDTVSLDHPPIIIVTEVRALAMDRGRLVSSKREGE